MARLRTTKIPSASSNVIDPEALAETEQGALSVKQAIEQSGESRRTLFALMEQGHLKWYRAGAHRRITRKSLHEYMARLYAAHKAGA